MKIFQFLLNKLLVILLLQGVLASLCFAHEDIDEFDLPFEAEFDDDFRLIDQNDRSQTLYYYRDYKYVLLVSGCAGCQNTFKTFKKNQKLFTELENNKLLKVLFLNSSTKESREDVNATLLGLGINDAIVLMDDYKIVSKDLKFKSEGDFSLWSTKKYKHVLTGNLNYKNCLPSIKKVVSNQANKKKSTNNFCVETFFEKISNELSGFLSAKSKLKSTGVAAKRDLNYENHIKPIISNHCIRCHDDKTFGDFRTYESVKSWSSMIRQVVRTKRMPPGGRDYKYGSFYNDLDPMDMKQLVDWIDAGMKKGSTNDKSDSEPDLRGWVNSPVYWLVSQSKPDLILKQKKPHIIPATGLLEYQYAQIYGPTKKDMWVRGFKLKVNKRVVHHANILLLDEPLNRSKHSQVYDGMIKYNKGQTILGVSRDRLGLAKLVDEKIFFTSRKLDDSMVVMREGEALFIPKNKYIAIEFHYNTSGKVEKNRATLELVLYPPGSTAREIKRMCVYRDGFTINPGEKDFVVKSVVPLNKDIEIIAFKPHFHYRGKSIKYKVKYPAGNVETLLSIPNYQIKAQPQFRLKSRAFVPKGSSIITEVIYDNSKYFYQNPDPDMHVNLGSQTYEYEMHLPRIFYLEGRGKKRRKK